MIAGFVNKYKIIADLHGGSIAWGAGIMKRAYIPALVSISVSCYSYCMKKSANTVAEASPPYAEDGLNDDGLYPDGVCPICAAHNYMPNAETIAAIEECRAMKRGEIPSTLRRFNSFEEMWEDLMRDEPDDMDD